ncbi:MAG TPA: DUF1345 domain-containing protein [Microvirga sp.]|jgi:uncharacterized membrane protein|nr:DUF1345 domain-containing protein [Microvirga sp.]
MPSRNRAHVRRHVRFYGAALLGGITWLVLDRLHMPLRLPVAGLVFFGAYLASTAVMLHRITPAYIRRRAAWEDEGIGLIVVLTLLAIASSLGGMVSLLNDPGKPDAIHLTVSILTVPLGWTTLHVIMAFHYAHLFYSRRADAMASDAGGLDFPHTREPGSWDFFYYAFVVGMTAQVSDVQVTDTRMRKATLLHGVVSFFFNTVILALAVNVVLTTAG